MKFFVARVRFKDEVSHPLTLWDSDLPSAIARVLKHNDNSDIRGMTVVNRPGFDSEFFNHHEEQSRDAFLEHANVAWRHEWE